MRDASDLVTLVQQRMAAVSGIYKRVIFQQQTREGQDVTDTGFALRGGMEGAAPDASNQEILERLAGDSPRLYAIARRDDLAPVARRNLFRFLSSALTSSERYAARCRLAHYAQHRSSVRCAARCSWASCESPRNLANLDTRRLNSSLH